MSDDRLILEGLFDRFQTAEDVQAEVQSWDHSNEREKMFGFMIDHGLHSDENDQNIAGFVLMSFGQSAYHPTPVSQSLSKHDLLVIQSFRSHCQELKLIRRCSKPLHHP